MDIYIKCIQYSKANFKKFSKILASLYCQIQVSHVGKQKKKTPSVSKTSFNEILIQIWGLQVTPQNSNVYVML